MYFLKENKLYMNTSLSKLTSIKKNSKSKKLKEWINIFHEQINIYQNFTNTLKNSFLNHLENLTKIKKKNFFLLENPEMISIRNFFVKEKKELKKCINNYKKKEEIYINDIFKEIQKMYKNVLSSQSMRNIDVKDFIEKKINKDKFFDFNKNLEKNSSNIFNRKSCSLNSKKKKLSQKSIKFNNKFNFSNVLEKNSILKINNLDDKKKILNLNMKNKKNLNLEKFEKTVKWTQFKNKIKSGDLKLTLKNEKFNINTTNSHKKTLFLQKESKNFNNLGGNFKKNSELYEKNNLIQNHLKKIDLPQKIINSLENDLKKDLDISIKKKNLIKFPKFQKNFQLKEKFQNYRKRRKMSEFGDNSNKNNNEILALKSDILRQFKEINMLNEELKILRRNLNQKNKDNNILKEKIERDIKDEKRMHHSFVKNLNRNLKYKEKEIKKLKINFLENEKKKLKFKNNRENIEILKIGLQNLVKDKNGFKNKLDKKEIKIKYLENKIFELKKLLDEHIKEKNDLKLTNTVLTDKFIQSIERENIIIFKIEKLKIKLKAYEKYFSELNI